jgi:hypothetical protein
VRAAVLSARAGILQEEAPRPGWGRPPGAPPHQAIRRIRPSAASGQVRGGLSGAALPQRRRAPRGGLITRPAASTAKRTASLPLGAGTVARAWRPA